MVTKSLNEVLANPPMYGLNAAACDYSNVASKYIRITDITDDGKYSPTDNAYVLSDDERYLLCDNDIVLARTGASVGKAYLYNKNDGKLIFAGFLIKVSIDPQKADSRYIFECFHTKRYWEWVRSESARSGQPGINGQQYAGFELQLPTLPEQRSIAAALSDADAYIAALEKLLAKKRAVKQGAMQELLTGNRRLPGFSGEWITCLLPEVLIKGEGIKIGPFGSQLKKEYLVSDGAYRVYGQENVYENDFSFGYRYLTLDRFLSLQSCEIKTGDFLISTMGTIGKCAIVPTNICTGIMDSHLIRLRIDTVKLLSEYLLQLFSSNFDFLENQTKKLSVGGIMDGLSTKIVCALEIMYPEHKEEQAAIVEVLSDMDAEIDALMAKLNKAKHIKQGMMSELLTGRIRLVETEKGKATAEASPAP